MTTTITGYTRPSGVVVIQAHREQAKIAQVVTRASYPFIVVNLWQRPTHGATVDVFGRTHPRQDYTPTLAVVRRTSSYDTASRYRRRPGDVVLRRHTDGTYSEMDTGWNGRQQAIRRRESEARWLSEVDGDHHQVLVVFEDGRTERIGDPSRRFEWHQAQARHDALTADPLPGQRWAMVRAENDPQYLDVPWHRPEQAAA